MKFEKETLYIWVGGSCDYGHKERAGGGAYIAEQNGMIVDKFTLAEFETTEFRMILKAVIHAMEKFANKNIVFLSNVQYLQNFDKHSTPEMKKKDRSNTDLIERCIALKMNTKSVNTRILPYHKFPQQTEVHLMASDAMQELRKQALST